MGEFAEMMMWLYHSSFCSIEAILLIHILCPLYLNFRLRSRDVTTVCSTRAEHLI